MAAPTLIQYGESTWNTAATSLNTGSVSWQTGDIIGVIAGCETNDTLGLPTASGLSFTSQKSNVAGSTCGTQLATAVAASSGSGAITVTCSALHIYGVGVWVWRGSAGVGNSVEQHTTTATVNLTPLAPNAGIIYGIFDFSAAAVLTITPTPTFTRQRVAIGSNYSVYVADLANQVSGAATPYGLTSGSGVLSIVALEIKASANTNLSRISRPFPFKPGSGPSRNAPYR